MSDSKRIYYVQPPPMYQSTARQPILEADTKKRPNTALTICLIATVFILTLCVIGLAIGLLVLVLKANEGDSSTGSSIDSATTPSVPHGSPYKTLVSQHVDLSNYIQKELMDNFQTKNIENNLIELTQKVHVAGTPEQLAIMDKINTKLKALGFETLVDEYKVFLTFPNYSNPNTVYTKANENSNWEIVSNGLSKVLGPPEAQAQQTDKRAFVYWNAYSKTGTAGGQTGAKLVYANYGTVDDFKVLESMGISVNGTIVLVRYGKMWRGAKTYEAARRGATGVLLFSDPADYTNIKGGEGVFPDSVWLPPDAAQRGTMSQRDGDPLTPFLPSKPWAYRSVTEDQLRSQDIIPRIPVTPIGYRDAAEVLKRMNGPLAPASFTGGIPGATYRLTSGAALFQVNVHGHSDHRAAIKNVIGYWRKETNLFVNHLQGTHSATSTHWTDKGSEEPDKLVLLSNHVDAWTYGAQDPNSGTATALEMARVLSVISREIGWRPRRTMAFCFWDAEEYGLVGSNEFVENYIKVLEQRAVAVVNVDDIAGNVTFGARGTPTLYRVLYDLVPLIPNPNAAEVALNRSTVYDSWKHYQSSSQLPMDPQFPTIGLPGSGSDFQRFLSFAGVPILSLSYSCSYCYPLYHTAYELEWTVATMVDRGFKVHKALGQIWLDAARQLADGLVLPFNVVDYATMLDVYVKQLDTYLVKGRLPDVIQDYEFFMSQLKDAVARFSFTAQNIQKRVDKANSGQPVAFSEVLRLNSILLGLERAFIKPRGLYPGRELFRHVVYAPSLQNSYAGATFAGVSDSAAFYLERTAAGDTTAAERWLQNVKIGVSDLQYAVESAILLLRS